jgi:hypothetical protein
MNYTTKQGNTKKALKATLLTNNQPINLSTVQTIQFRMRQGPKVLVDKEVQPLDAINGVVWVVFEAEEVEQTGYFTADFTVTHSDGRVESFPDQSNIQITILPRG